MGDISSWVLFPPMKKKPKKLPIRNSRTRSLSLSLGRQVVARGGVTLPLLIIGGQPV